MLAALGLPCRQLVAQYYQAIGACFSTLFFCSPWRRPVELGFPVAGRGARREHLHYQIGRAQAATRLNFAGVANDADVRLHHGVDGLVGSGAALRQAHIVWTNSYLAGLPAQMDAESSK